MKEKLKFGYMRIMSRLNLNFSCFHLKMDHLECSITLACTAYPYHLSMNSTDISQLVI